VCFALAKWCRCFLSDRSMAIRDDLCRRDGYYFEKFQ
jgi:hypothetical protein